MGRVRVRYVRQKGGGYYFEATPAMRRAGFQSRPLGQDLGVALERAREILASWDAHRLGFGQETYVAGTFRWLVREFERSSWYTTLGPRSQEEADRHFAIIVAEWGKVRVAAVERRHCRLLHDRRTEKAGLDHANRTLKWVRRLLNYAVERGLRGTNPASRMGLKGGGRRRVRWTRAEVRRFVATADAMGSPSWGLAVLIGYETSQRLGDVLGLTWHQYDGEGFDFAPAKTRATGIAESWAPLTDATNRRLKAMTRRSVYVIVGDRDGKPIKQRAHWNRIFRRIKKAAGLGDHLWFHDLRRTAASEVNAGGGKVEPLTGHRPGSPVLKHYVVPDKDAARAAQKSRKWDTE